MKFLTKNPFFFFFFFLFFFGGGGVFFYKVTRNPYLIIVFWEGGVQEGFRGGGGGGKGEGTCMNKCFKWHFYSSRRTPVQNYFEIHAYIYRSYGPEKHIYETFKCDLDLQCT